MKCSYCLHDFHHTDKVQSYKLRESSESQNWELFEWICPNCQKSILDLYKYSWYSNNKSYEFFAHLKPINISRKALPDYIDNVYKNDYEEASLVLSISPKASAALSRRCLQLILRDKGWYNQRDLADQIQTALDEWKLPSHISEGLDAVRNIGNFAAHPNKSRHTWEIVDVESGEAEWSLDILEGLFDFYFIQPELTRQKKEKLNQKLTEMWKPTI